MPKPLDTEKNNGKLKNISTIIYMRPKIQYSVLFLFIYLHKLIISFQNRGLTAMPIWTKSHNDHGITMQQPSPQCNSGDQCVIFSKTKDYICEPDLTKNEFLRGKKLITISPGGFKGFYLLGILTYIKQQYNLENYIFSGASAGSWNSLFMCYKGDPIDFVYQLVDHNIKNTKSIPELEYFLKYKLLTNWKDEDFDLQRLFIGITTFRKFKPCTDIFSDFENLEDAINGCMASSHIPFITGGFTNKYHNILSFDGGFSSYPYLNTDNLVLHVSPSMWRDLSEEKKENTNIKQKIRSLKEFTELFSVSKNNLMELFDDGYQDAKQRKPYLDSIFT